MIQSRLNSLKLVTIPCDENDEESPMIVIFPGVHPLLLKKTFCRKKCPLRFSQLKVAKRELKAANEFQNKMKMYLIQMGVLRRIHNFPVCISDSINRQNRNLFWANELQVFSKRHLVVRLSLVKKTRMFIYNGYLNI